MLSYKLKQNKGSFEVCVCVCSLSHSDRPRLCAASCVFLTAKICHYHLHYLLNTKFVLHVAYQSLARKPRPSTEASMPQAKAKF